MLARIGKYEIRDELGKGGFGQVYLGFDPTMDRSVAIKVLTAGGDSSQLIRFQTEATAAGNLTHKNIVTVYEFGEDRGMFFLAMEYLAGQDLQKVIDADEPRSILEKMRIMTQVAEGLLCAHQGGVVHRDVKPANVMLLPDGTVKVMDFGIARLTRGNSVRLTEAGYLIGSVSHMAPEQFRGVEADVLCDIWAYGTIYYELLTGKNPFHASDAPSTMYQITNVEPCSASSMCLDCPEALERVIAGLLAKDRANRYQSLEDVLFETAPILGDLQKGEIGRFISQAKQLISEGKMEDAHPLVRKVLILDPMHPEGRILREQILTDTRIRSTRGRIEALRSKAEKAIVERNYPEAIQALGSALQINPGDTSLRERLSELQIAQERREKSARLLSNAKNELELQKLTSAFQSATEALHAEPGNTEAKELISQIENIIAGRDAERRLRDGLTKVRGLLVVEALDEALEVLDELAQIVPEHPQVQEMLARTHRQREARERRTHVTSGIESARREIKSGDFASAITILEALAKEYPDETSVGETLAYARDELQAKERAARIKAVGNEAWAALKAKEFDHAARLVADGLSSYPGNERLLRLQDVIQSARAERDREESIIRATEESTRLRQANRFDDALAVLEAALRENPAHPELKTARDELRRHMEEQERKRRAEAIQEALTKARGMVQGGKAESATKLLEKATAKYPNEPELASLFEWARKEQERQREAQVIAEILSRASALEKEGRIAHALEAVEDGLLTYPTARELLNAASRLQTLNRLKEDLDAIAQPMARKDWDNALTLLTSAMERHPQEEAFSRLAEQAREEQRKAAADSVSAQARRELDAHDLERAVETIAGGLRTFGPVPILIALEAEAKRAVERRENLASARQLCDKRNWTRAEVVLRRMIERDDSDREAHALLKGVSKERENEQNWKFREEGREDARRALRELRFEDAETRLQNLLREFPADSALADELRRVTGAKQQHGRQDAHQKGRQAAGAALKARRFDAAIEELQRLLVQFPGDSAIAADLQAAIAARQAHEQREASERERRRASEFLAKREFDSAIRTLEQFLERYPGDPGVEEDLQAAKGAKALFAQRQLLDQQVQELEKLYRKGDPHAVREQAGRVEPGVQDPRIRELKEWADAEIARLAGERARESADTLQQRRRRNTLAAAGLAAAAVVTGLLIWYAKSTQTSSGFTLSSPDLSFNVAADGKEIVSQTIQLKSVGKSQAWSATATDRWLSSNPVSGTTPASIKVSLDPAHLDPGTYTGLLIFSGVDTSAKANLKVSVTVDAPKRIETTEVQPPLIRQTPSPLTVVSGMRTTAAKGETAPVPGTRQETEPAPLTPTPVIEKAPAPIEKQQIIDCYAANYHGLRDAKLIWANGSLEPNGILVLGAPGQVVAGGKVTGTPLPGCEISITAEPSQQLDVVEKPMLKTDSGESGCATNQRFRFQILSFSGMRSTNRVVRESENPPRPRAEG